MAKIPSKPYPTLPMPPLNQHPQPLPPSQQLRNPLPLPPLPYGDRLDSVTPVEVINALVPGYLRVCALRVEDVDGDGGEVAGGEGGCETGVGD